MTITQHAHIYSFHTSNFTFGQIIFLKFLSIPPLYSSSFDESDNDDDTINMLFMLNENIILKDCEGITWEVTYLSSQYSGEILQHKVCTRIGHDFLVDGALLSPWMPLTSASFQEEYLSDPLLPSVLSCNYEPSTSEDSLSIPRLINLETAGLH
jgi:hypothetical protein